MTKLYCKKTGEIQIVESTEENFIKMAIRLWVMNHNHWNPSKRITKRDIIIID